MFCIGEVVAEYPRGLVLSRHAVDVLIHTVMYIYKILNIHTMMFVLLHSVDKRSESEFADGLGLALCNTYCNNRIRSWWQGFVEK